MNEYMKTIISGLKQWVSSQKPDWNQNDSSASNYVKNRTHYEEEKILTLVDNLTSEDYNNGNNIPKCNFISGNSYNVVFNDILYENLVCYEEEGYRIIGSTEELPFYIDDDGGDSFYIEAPDYEEFVVSVFEHVSNIHKLDKKYLPDDLVRTENIADVAISGSYQDLVDAYIIDEAINAIDETVKHSSQSLTEEQKLQARTNIGASDFSGNYNDLTEKPCAHIVEEDFIGSTNSWLNTHTSGSRPNNTRCYKITDCTLTEGSKYKVVFSNMATETYTGEHIAEIKSFVEYGTTLENVCIGNLSLYKSSAYDSGEDFLIMQPLNSNYIYIYVDNDSVTAGSIKLYLITETFEPLDERLLPDTTVHTVDFDPTTIFIFDCGTSADITE